MDSIILNYSLGWEAVRCSNLFAVQIQLVSYSFPAYQNHQKDLASLWIVMWVLSWWWCFLSPVIVHIPFGNVVNVPLFNTHILSYIDILKISSLVQLNKLKACTACGESGLMPRKVQWFFSWSFSSTSLLVTEGEHGEEPSGRRQSVSSAL